jgi:hypothetical protein
MPGGTEENHEQLVRLAGLQAEIGMLSSACAEYSRMFHCLETI